MSQLEDTDCGNEKSPEYDGINFMVVEKTIIQQCTGAADNYQSKENRCSRDPIQNGGRNVI